MMSLEIPGHIASDTGSCDGSPHIGKHYLMSPPLWDITWAPSGRGLLCAGPSVRCDRVLGTGTTRRQVNDCPAFVVTTCFSSPDMPESRSPFDFGFSFKISGFLVLYFFQNIHNVIFQRWDPNLGMELICVLYVCYRHSLNVMSCNTFVCLCFHWPITWNVTFSPYGVTQMLSVGVCHLGLEMVNLKIVMVRITM